MVGVGIFARLRKPPLQGFTLLFEPLLLLLKGVARTSAFEVRGSYRRITPKSRGLTARVRATRSNLGKWNRLPALGSLLRFA